MRIMLAVWLLLAMPVQAADVGIAQSPAPTTNGGTQDFTVSGFGTPKCALYMAGYGTANGAAVPHAMLSVGASNFTNNVVTVGASEDAQLDSDTGSSSSATDAMRTLLNTTQAVDGSATASTIPDGSRLTWSDAPPDAYLVNAVLFGGENISNCYVGTLAGSATLDGTASTTAPGFQPDIVIAFAMGNDGITAHWRNSVGFAVNDGGVVQRAVGFFDDNASASMQVGSVIRADRITVNALVNTLASLELTSLDPNGLTVTTRDAAAAVTMRFLALKLANGLRAKVLTCPTPIVTGPASCTGTGWRPQYGMLLQSEGASVGTYFSTDNGEVWGVGAMTALGAASSSVYSEDSDGTSNTESITSLNPIRIRKDSLDFMTATFVGFQDNGVDLSYSVTSGTERQLAALFIEAPSSAPTSTRVKRGGIYLP